MTQPAQDAVDRDTVVRALFEQLPELVVVIGADGLIKLANQRLLDTMGYELDEALGSNIFDYVHPDDLAYMVWSWENRETHPGETGIVVHARGRNSDGSWRALEILGLSLLEDDTVSGMVMSMRDLTNQAALADSPARLRSMVDRTTDVVLLLDREGHIVYANRRLTSRYGIDQDRVVGRSLASILSPSDRGDTAGWLADLVDAGDRASSRIRLRIEASDGIAHDVEWHGTNQLDDPLIDGLILSGRDITDLVRMEEQVRRQTAQLVHTADHDALTGLLNRRAFMDRVDGALDDWRGRDDDGDTVMLFCDLDRFKAVNDTHGHEVGDQVLAEVALRLRSCLRRGDLLARYGGDEFTILLADTPSTATVTALVARIAAKVAEPIVCGDVVAEVGVTIGISRESVATAEVETMLRAADQSMYDQKSKLNRS